MSELSRRRRWFGRSLIGASALALPLTASISYAAANAQAPEPVEPAEPAAAPLPAAPVLAEDDRGGPGFVERRVGADGKHTVRDLSWNVPRPAPHWPNNPEFQAEMEEFQREMEQFRAEWAENQDWEKYGEQWAEWGRKHGEQWGKHWEKWGEQQREQALAQAQRARERAAQQREQALARSERQREQAAQQREQALARAAQQREQAQAWAAAARMAPVVVRSCDDDDRRRTTTSDGRPRVVICPTDMRQIASSSLRYARESIAHNNEMSAEVRAEVLRDLDAEIERIEREEND